MPTTDGYPKCFAEVGGRRILDWAIGAFAECSIARICFIGGYQIDKVRSSYPQFTFYHNVDWENNQILASLMCAEAEMSEPFVCCYSDILFTSQVVRRLLAAEADISLAVDAAWLKRYAHRTQHPTDDAEKVATSGGLITRIGRDIDQSVAYGEYIGLAKFSAEGATALREHYRRCRRLYAGRPFRESPSFEKAYLIHLFQEMIEAGVEIAHVDTPGGYMEIDTQQDFELARQFWR
jgi:choline kinase